MSVTRSGARPAAVVLAACVGLGLVGSPAVADPQEAFAVRSLPQDVANAVELTGVNRHLIALQRIAEQNGGTRADGEPGYDASIDYVVGRLRAAGYDVSTPEFDYELFVASTERLAVAGESVDLEALEFTPSTAEGGLTAPLAVLPAGSELGCAPEDYAGVDAEGSVLLIRRGECDFALKARLASEAGAAAALIANNVDGALSGTLGDPSLATIPTGGVTRADGDALWSQAGADVELELIAGFETRTSRNVIAQTRTGRTDNVVVAGAHLDSVYAGINDNGTGSAALLETAVQLGGAPDVDNAVRFAWWGAEELGLHGSTQYVRSLDFEQQLDIALYLNFDMIGSPNAGYFVLDGDGSEGLSAPGPYGSAQIEQAFVDYFAEGGIETEGADFSGRSDYAEFIAVGIPSGGLFTGAEGLKTEEQAEKWGGVAGEAYDPNYHFPADDLGNVDRVALERNAKAVAYVTTAYGESTETVNGVPPRAKRAEIRATTRVASASAHRADLVAS
ncbi:Zn-dependent M28 family amino/carboxypeptidase [Actinoalloteichus hoggarensis]|uniref:Leupeptin-inactivating enzyme 1 n=1 Tax=Actinoalloteichus hoggarensis TaxID=1470176 RepID=A0A221VW96_9PSEU|nr:M28 family peptidase [Actinoalloteichus hoggarensis]ASO17820.1 Leupeptin-inactivating enzyme 1 precursor [Actinoalloteichus hoggarensis]MBB5922947.1 Zn-dependent M28 family amino/carboxypeptidase [Actinoalloteichus hoggarensis]